MRLRLTLAMAAERDVWPVLDGTAKPEGIDLVPHHLPPPDIHYRQFRNAEFDVAELGMISLLGTDPRWVGIPVFPTRKMFHTTILVRRDSGIEKPADLKGRRVGVPSFWQSAIIWTIGPLRDEFGVEPREMEFWMERDPEEWSNQSTGKPPTDRQLPKGVTAHVIPHSESIPSLLLANKLDAALYYIGPAFGPSAVERSTIDLRNHPDVRYLFLDPFGEGIRYYKATGIYPINHTVVIKREVVEQHPQVPRALFKCFQAASEIMTRRRVDQVRFYAETGLVPREVGDIVREPVVKYGIAANRKVLNKYAAYAHEFGCNPLNLKGDEVFAPSLLDT